VLSDLRVSPAEVRALQDGRVAAMVATAAARHPHYRRRFAAVGLDVRAVRGVDDLVAVPVTTKDDLAGDPDGFRLDPSDPPSPDDQLWDVAYTSGSTSRPTPLYQTSADFRGILLAQRRMAEIRGMTGADRIANLYPLTPQPHGAWTRANHAAAVLGAYLVVGMSGAATGPERVHRHLDEVAALVADRAPTVLWGVPSYLRRVVERIVTTGQSLRSVRMLAVSGEPCTAEMTRALHDVLAAAGSPDIVVSNSLGASELQCGLVECTPGSGFHNPAPELFLFQALGEDDRPVTDGGTGRLALTHLDRGGTVLLRYLLGDVVTITDAPCPHCGRAGGRVVAHHRREGHRTKVRGSLLDVRVLEQAIRGVPAVAEFQSVVRRAVDGDPLSMDELLVRVSAGPGVHPDLPAAVRAAVQRAVNVTPTVEVVDAEAIYDPDRRLKPVRFTDVR